MSETSIEAPGVYVERLVSILTAAPERRCLRHAGVDICAGAFLASINRFARAFEARGVGRGDVVAIFALNCPDALAVRYATNLVGAAATYLSEAGTAQGRADLLASLAPKLIVVFSQTACLVPLAISAPLAGVGVAPPGGFDLLAAAADQSSAAFSCRAQSGDIAVIGSSGGSTGVPKGSWRTFATYTAMVGVSSAADRRQLINGPLAYLSQVLVDITLLGGGTVVLRDQYDPTDTAATIEAERITDLFLVEPQLFDLMDHPQLASTDLSSLRTLTHIGASAPPTLRRRARRRFGARIVHAYGSSEEGLVSVLTAAECDPAQAERLCSAGRVLPGVNVRFRREDGTLAAQGEIGSIEVRSPAVAQGYRNRPEIEAIAFQDGWYRSGDLGRFDEDGYLYIFGRAADVSFVEGRMIGPTAIEDTLCRVPQVRYASVVMDPHTCYRVGVLLPWLGTRIDEAICLKAVTAEHGYAVGRSLILITCGTIPLTAQGKPDREAIRALGQAALATRGGTAGVSAADSPLQ
jgi:fatty-acyl-CoA synthase